jgi:glutamate synthase (NADPH) large chain
VAERILKNWDASIKQFVKVMPKDYKAVMLKKKEQNKKKAIVAK